MHLPVAVHRHPGPGDHPHHEEPRAGQLSEGSGRRLVAHNLDRGSTLGDAIEVAGGFWGKFRGLMLRSALPSGGGLWLPGGNGIHMMFMRFPIDAVFLGREDTEGVRVVVAVRQSLPPWTGIVPLIRRAVGCLELPAGVIAGSGTRVGDRIALETAAD